VALVLPEGLQQAQGQAGQVALQAQQPVVLLHRNFLQQHNKPSHKAEIKWVLLARCRRRVLQHSQDSHKVRRRWASKPYRVALLRA
jgi:hypothetical protein